MLREQVLRGGAFLVVRQGLAVGAALIGTLGLTHLIGPVAFGLYATASGALFFVSLVARIGVDVFLVRHRDDSLAAEVYHQAVSLLVVSGTLLGALGIALSPLLAAWLGDARALPPMWALLALLPVSLSYLPVVAQLERALDYKRVATVETVEPILNYSLALVFAWFGFGVWAPVIGYGTSQLWLVVANCVAARYRPRWYWSWPLANEILRYGLSYSASMWLSYTRPLLAALLIGRFLGPEGVAYMSLADRLVEGLSVVKSAAYRLSLAALTKIQSDPVILRRSVEEGMALQVLVQGPLLACFALAAPWVVPLLFGDQWTPALVVFPFLALGSIVAGVFTMHTSVLYITHRNRDAFIFGLARSLTLSLAALFFLPRFGLLGWGLAELAALSSYAVLHRQISRMFPYRFDRVSPWLIAFVPPLFTLLTGWPTGLLLLVPAALVAFSWTARAQVTEYWTIIWGRYA